VLDVLREHSVEASGEVAGRAATQLLDAVPPGQTIDAVIQLAQRLPAAMSQAMFGLESQDVASVASWARDITVGLEPQMTSAQARQRVLALYRFGDYLTAQIDRHQADPRDNLLNSLILAGKASGDLVGDELIATAMLFLAALFGSTVDMVGNLVAVMARNPDQYRLVREQPDLVAPAIDELFRYESPFQLIYRMATGDLDISGVGVPSGTRIALLLGAANRDPAHFVDPDTYDVQRSGNRHIAFGFGLHNCVGIPYSRIWARAVLTSMIERMANITAVGPFPARRARAFRGYASVPVRWHPVR
jgi:cytochrome P450